MTIGFFGYNREQTLNNFKTFIEANKDQILKFNRDSCRINFSDPDDIIVISNDIAKTKSYIFDYVIVSDDSRMLALDNLPEIRWSGIVPEEFRIIQDNIDTVVQG